MPITSAWLYEPGSELDVDPQIILQDYVYRQACKDIVDDFENQSTLVKLLFDLKKWEMKLIQKDIFENHYEMLQTYMSLIGETMAEDMAVIILAYRG